MTKQCSKCGVAKLFPGEFYKGRGACKECCRSRYKNEAKLCPAEKVCPRCKERRQSDEFNRSSASKDGLASYCRTCAAKASKELMKQKRIAARENPAPLPATKQCTKCGDIKPSEGFTRDSANPTGLFSWCKDCVKQSSQHRRESDREKHRFHHKKHRYGITRADYQRLFQEQGEVCKICGQSARLGVDHDHVTGRVRGLLCHKCNAGIGLLCEDVEVLRRAISYLED
jgi:hypothetical protein